MTSRDADRIFCASSPAAQRMDDETFWTHVYMVSEPWIREDREDDEAWRFHSEPAQVWNEDIASGGACPICGAVGACGWDGNGLPLIHAIPLEMDA